VTITSTGANSSANGLVIGDITENPANTFGAWAQNHNTVRFTGTTAGICLLLGAAVRGTAGGARIHECAYNLMLNVASYTAGVPYGVYSVGRNVHCHHNNAYSRSPCTFVGPVDNLVELNNWVAPSGNLKGIASLTQHVGGPDPTDSIFRQNIFVALHNTASNYAFHVEGAAPSGLEVDRNWYGIVGQGNLVLQNITALSPAATLAEAQARWNTLGGASAGGDLNSVLDTYDVFADPANGDFSFKTGVVDTIRELGYPLGATALPGKDAKMGVGLGIGVS
jgi:hypothetical protein